MKVIDLIYLISLIIVMISVYKQKEGFNYWLFESTGISGYVFKAFVLLFLAFKTIAYLVYHSNTILNFLNYKLF